MSEHIPRSQPPELEPGRDALTGLPNRAWLDAELENFAETMPGKFALVFVDLDDLKRINDTQGHLVGDELILKAAGILSSTIRSEGVGPDKRPQDSLGMGHGAYRHGGDEFVVLLAGVSEQPQVNAFIRRARAELADKGVEASFGGRPHIPQEPAKDLLHDADFLMYFDKDYRKRERYGQKPMQKRLAKILGSALLKYYEKD